MISELEQRIADKEAELEKLRALVDQGIGSNREVTAREADLSKLKADLANRRYELDHADEIFNEAVESEKALSGQRSRPKPPAPAKDMKPAALWTFDRAVAALPALFGGEDPAEYASTLAKGLKPKDEFETTAEYQARIRSAVPDRPCAFMLDYYDGDDQYEADGARYLVRVHGAGFVDDGNIVGLNNERVTDLRGIVLATRTRYLSQDEPVEYGVYVATGATLAARSAHLLGSSGRSVPVPLARDRARPMKGKLRALVVGKFDGSNPNITCIRSRAVVANRFEYLARFAPDEIWIYNFETGEILARDTVEEWRKKAVDARQ